MDGQPMNRHWLWGRAGLTVSVTVLEAEAAPVGWIASPQNQCPSGTSHCDLIWK